MACGQTKSSDGETLDICQYLLPSGETANLTDLGSVGEGIGFTVFNTRGSYYDPSRTDMMFIANFEAVGAPNASLSSWHSADNASTVASECALWMCVQSYATKQVNANQTQTVLKEYSTVDNSSTLGNYVANITFVDIPSDMNVMSSSMYQVEVPAYLAMQQFLSGVDVFTGNISLNQEGQITSNDIISGIWNSSADLNSWIKSVASGMSNVIRTYDSSTPAEKQFYRGSGSQLGYDVRWAWISLPAASVVLSMFILIVIILRTARSPVRAWKGSPLALLFTDVDPELRRHVIGSMDKYDGIKNLAGKTPITLEDRGYGNWSMRKAA